MAVSTDNKIHIYHPSLVNLQPHCFNYFRETRNILPRKRISNSNLILSMKKKMVREAQYKYYHKNNFRRIFNYPSNALVPMNMPYPHTHTCPNGYHHNGYQQVHYPITMDDCLPLHPPMHNLQPVLLNRRMAPLPKPIVQPLYIGVAPIIPQHNVLVNVPNLSNCTNSYNYNAGQVASIQEIPTEETYYQEENAAAQTYYTDVNNTSNTSIGSQMIESEPLENYFNLPAGLFPSPRMLAVDPNPIIDEFCKVSNVMSHAPWLLDLEYGIPKAPVTRPIPIYNVKFNSIHCRNTPDAIHPGFESCNPDFKRILQFYYDSIVSPWYNGYMILNRDGSVENFQSWLHPPMQALGVNWT